MGRTNLIDKAGLLYGSLFRSCQIALSSGGACKTVQSLMTVVLDGPLATSNPLKHLQIHGPLRVYLELNPIRFLADVSSKRRFLVFYVESPGSDDIK